MADKMEELQQKQVHSLCEQFNHRTGLVLVASFNGVPTKLAFLDPDGHETSIRLFDGPASMLDAIHAMLWVVSVTGLHI